MSAIHELMVQVALENDSSLPKDRAINTFHFNNATGLAWTTAEIDAVRDSIDSFYRTAHTGSSAALMSFLGAQLSGVWTMKFYDLHDTPPRVPIRTETPAVLTPGGSAMPAEVALCLSYQGARVSGMDQRNRRGRLFIGPLSTTAQASSTGLPVTIADGVVDTLCAAGTYLAGAAAFAGLAAWDVYSPTLDSFALVTDGWVDNAFDTQRRRGPAPTTRQLWT